MILLILPESFKGYDDKYIYPLVDNLINFFDYYEIDIKINKKELIKKLSNLGSGEKIIIGVSKIKFIEITFFAYASSKDDISITSKLEHDRNMFFNFLYH